MRALTAPTSAFSALSALGCPSSDTAAAHHAFPDRGVDCLWITSFKETWPHLVFPKQLTEGSWSKNSASAVDAGAQV